MLESPHSAFDHSDYLEERKIMTNDQKQVLRGLALLLGFGAAMYASIYYADKTARETINRYTIS